MYSTIFHEALKAQALYAVRGLKVSLESASEYILFKHCVNFAVLDSRERTPLSNYLHAYGMTFICQRSEEVAAVF